MDHDPSSASVASLNRPQDVRSPIHLVRPLRWSDLWRASGTVQLSAHPDPFYVYRYGSAKKQKLWRVPFEDLRERIYFCVVMAFWVYRGTGYTIGRGLAVVSMESGQPKGIVDKIWDRFLHIFEKLMCTRSKEQIKRGVEMETIMKNLVENSLGKDAADMVVINSLATHPNVRGRGYGGALVEFVSRTADERRCSTYLFSSNPTNSTFYNNRGYSELSASLLGESNPEWKMSPVRCPLFCRRYVVDTNAS